MPGPFSWLMFIVLQAMIDEENFRQRADGCALRRYISISVLLVPSRHHMTLVAMYV